MDLMIVLDRLNAQETCSLYDIRFRTQIGPILSDDTSIN